jgi:DNA-directed RNA polymerase subunit E'
VFRIVSVRDYIRVPPTKFGEPIDKIAVEQLRELYEGRVERDLGIFVTVFDIKINKRGIVMFGDGGAYHRVEFKALAFVPLINEVVEGEVVDTHDYGAFIRIGPATAFMHKTQIADENVIHYDRQSKIFIIGEKTPEKTPRRLGKGDIVRAKIAGVSYFSTSDGNRVNISLTARQPFLGKLEWIDEELQKKKIKPQQR